MNRFALRMDAMSVHASAEAIEASQSFASLRHRPGQLQGVQSRLECLYPQPRNGGRDLWHSRERHYAGAHGDANGH